MRYENPKIPEGINVSKSHPLLDFGALLLGVAGIFLVIIVSLFYLSQWLLPYVPFSVEQKILASYEGETFFAQDLTDEERSIERYLQSLADKLIADSDFPEEMSLQVRYSSSEQKNAFASLGGHIVINAGLLQAVQSENGLAMVLGHEIGHIANRDPLMSMGRGVVALGAIALLSGFSQTDVANTLFNISTETLLFSFSREQERLADDYALDLIGRYYGHHLGADEFFSHVQEQTSGNLSSLALIEFFSTHPDLEERVERIAERVRGDVRSVNVATDKIPLPFATETKP